MYKVVWRDEATEDLARVDRIIAQKIFDRVENYLVKDPYNLGKPLAHHQYKSPYGYRFSRYRVVYQIKDQEVLITIIRVDHCREVYKK
jgi:mRNA interferase RelE/StbE